MKAFQRLEQFREESQFSTWLIRITVNQALMKLRKQNAIREVSLNEDGPQGGDTLPPEVADWAPNPEELYRTSELREILTRTLAELRPILRTVFVLRDLEGLSIAQTAAVLGLSQVAVKARLWRARLQLREHLNKYFRKQEKSARLNLGQVTEGQASLVQGRRETLNGCAGGLYPSETLGTKRFSEVARCLISRTDEGGCPPSSRDG